MDQYHYGNRNDIQRAGTQNILSAVMKELAWNPDRRFIYVEQASPSTATAATRPDQTTLTVHSNPPRSPRPARPNRYTFCRRFSRSGEILPARRPARPPTLTVNSTPLPRSPRPAHLTTNPTQRWWDEQDEKMQTLTRGLVASGQLEFINGGWCMHDEVSTGVS